MVRTSSIYTLPNVPWLTAAIERRWTTEFASLVLPTLEFIQLHSTWNHSVTRPIGDAASVVPLLNMWQERAKFLSVVQQLLQTFCHFDAMQPNLMAVDGEHGKEQTVAIDWALAGTGAVGSEVGPLVLGSLCFNRVPGAEARLLDTHVFTGYLAGLHDTGYQGTTDAVRFAYLVNAVLRFGILMPYWLHVWMDEQQAVVGEQPRDELITQCAQILVFAACLADEANQLLPNI